ncbi:MAG: hypothetical protein JWQ35_133 [Bacteriovoracaceae bacterium]|nr:hypothetical protein [Bacteriovoracaceae bacterium]
MNEGVGKVYDLQSLFDRLNRLYFDRRLELSIRWSKRSIVKAQTRVLLGYYSGQKKQITISKRLDNPRVPMFFVEHILFHEMLHAIFPSERHRMHTDKFKSFEKLHPDYERARIWEKESIKVLFEKPQKTLSFAHRLWEKVQSL